LPSSSPADLAASLATGSLAAHTPTISMPTRREWHARPGASKQQSQRETSREQKSAPSLAALRVHSALCKSLASATRVHWKRPQTVHGRRCGPAERSANVQQVFNGGLLVEPVGCQTRGLLSTVPVGQEYELAILTDKKAANRQPETSSLLLPSNWLPNSLSLSLVAALP